MVISLGKLAPRVIVLAVVGYCVWPSIAEFTPSSRAKPPAKRSESPALCLKPTKSTPPTTNPWGGHDAAALAEIRKAAEAKIVQTSTKSGKGSAARSSPALLLARLTLNATYIADDRQVAVINGLVCRAGQTTAFPDGAGSETSPCKIVRVFPQKVVLDCGGATIELTYSNGPPRTSSAFQSRLNNQTAAASKLDSFASRPLDK